MQTPIQNIGLLLSALISASAHQEKIEAEIQRLCAAAEATSN